MSRDRNGIGTGVVLITIGVIFLADRQGYGNFHHLWPLILIVMGTANILFPRDRMRPGVVVGRRGRYREHRFSGLLLILVGGILLMHQNNILSIQQSWPLFIVVAGLGILFSGGFNRSDPDPNSGDTNSTPGGGGQLS